MSLPNARSGKPARPRGNDHEYSTNSCYQTADGLVMIGASNLRQQRRLWHALGRTRYGEGQQ